MLLRPISIAENEPQFLASHSVSFHKVTETDFSSLSLMHACIGTQLQIPYCAQHSAAAAEPTVQYKLAVTVQHRTCLRYQAPRYLTDYCVAVSNVAGRRHMRSASRHQLTVPRVRCSTFGCRSFASAGPTVWISLPGNLRSPAIGPDLQFRWTLKTHLFACC